jgi:hypothetical protein
VWGVNLGLAKIFLADGTYNEVVQLSAPIGVPKTCSGCGGPGAAGGAANVEIAGDDANADAVVLSAPNGACVNGAVLIMVPPANYYIHGFKITATNEATNQCDDIIIPQGSYVMPNLMDFAVPSKGGSGTEANIVEITGGTFNIIGQTIYITAGTNKATAVFEISGGGHMYTDASTINFVGSNTLSGGAFGTLPAVFSLTQLGGWVGGVGGITWSGTVSAPCFFVSGGQSYVEGVQNQLNTSFAGCSVDATTGLQFGYGANMSGMTVLSQLATNHGAGGFVSEPDPTLTSCGSSPSIAGTDLAGDFTEGSGATGCTLVFANSYGRAPTCSLTPKQTASLSSFTYNGSGSAFTGFTIANSGALSFSYICVQHAP